MSSCADHRGSLSSRSAMSLRIVPRTRQIAMYGTVGHTCLGDTKSAVADHDQRNFQQTLSRLHTPYLRPYSTTLSNLQDHCCPEDVFQDHPSCSASRCIGPSAMYPRKPYIGPRLRSRIHTESYRG